MWAGSSTSTSATASGTSGCRARRPVSTLDLMDDGLTLFTGPEGEAWGNGLGAGRRPACRAQPRPSRTRAGHPPRRRVARPSRRRTRRLVVEQRRCGAGAACGCEGDRAREPARPRPSSQSPEGTSGLADRPVARYLGRAPVPRNAREEDRRAQCDAPISQRPSPTQVGRPPHGADRTRKGAEHGHSVPGSCQRALVPEPARLPRGRICRGICRGHE